MLLASKHSSQQTVPPPTLPSFDGIGYHINAPLPPPLPNLIVWQALAGAAVAAMDAKREITGYVPDACIKCSSNSAAGSSSASDCSSA